MTPLTDALLLTVQGVSGPAVLAIARTDAISNLGFRARQLLGGSRPAPVSGRRTVAADRPPQLNSPASDGREAPAPRPGARHNRELMPLCGLLRGIALSVVIWVLLVWGVLSLLAGLSGD